MVLCKYENAIPFVCEEADGFQEVRVKVIFHDFSFMTAINFTECKNVHIQRECEQPYVMVAVEVVAKANYSLNKAYNSFYFQS